MNAEIETELEYRLGPAARTFVKAQSVFAQTVNWVSEEIAAELSLSDATVKAEVAKFLNRLFEAEDSGAKRT